MSETSKSIPATWRVTTIGSVCSKPQYGWTTSAADSGDVKLLRTTDITRGPVDWSTVPFCRNVPPDIDKYLLAEGDIVVSRAGSVGVSCRVVAPERAVFASYLIRFRPTEAVDGKFLAYVLQSPAYWTQVRGSTAGIAIPNVNASKLEAFHFPLAPFPEQRRIVAEVEKQFTRLEAGVAALRRVQANLKRYRAAVLNAAYEGRLIASDMRAWKRFRVSQIGEAVTGNTPPTSDKENLGDELPFFKPTDLDAGYNVREARQYLSAKGVKLARVLPTGAILVTCIGATIGKTGFARVDCATNQQINGLVVNPKIAIPEWAFWLFSSPAGQQQIKSNASATTLPILNKSKFEALEFPVPPLAEQKRIVAEVERRLSVVEELEAVVSANLQRATRLRQSILQKAFVGDLVSQNPDDEPAEVLLKRLKDMPADTKSAKTNAKPKDQKIMPSKPVTTLEELLQRLDSIGGAAAPERLLAATDLGDEVEKFFDLLREGRNNGKLIVPMGIAGDIKRSSHEN